MRKLNDAFMSSLLTGNLSILLNKVKSDDTLCLAIRENYINIYYRGGNILRVIQNGKEYFPKFDLKYCNHKYDILPYKDKIKNCISIEDYIDCIPFIKAEMDLWFYEHPKSEREYQQIIYRDNNSGPIANDTDYFIADIEYANSENRSRFDLIGIKWLSNSASRKHAASPILALMEFKYGDSAISGGAGLVKHFMDIRRFIKSRQNYESLCSEVEEILNQNQKLGLLNISGKSRKIKIDRNKKCEFILLFANHKPDSTIIQREIVKAHEQCPDILDWVDIKIAVANNLGYGLYDNNMISVDEYLKTM